MIEAKILCDSVAPNGIRLTTFYLKYPRSIHSELCRHRTFSLSVGSSRAVPVNKMIERVEKEPFIPIYWGKNQKGMQATEEFDDITKMVLKNKLLEHRDNCIKFVKELMEIGVHKQIANRYLEPVLFLEHILTGTDFSNFFNLRVHKDAEPHFRELAKLMLIEYEKNTPNFVNEGEWHLPFCDKEMHDGLSIEEKIKVSFARCARVSYFNFDGGDISKDFELHNRLISVGHLSPAENLATPISGVEYCGNFRGWKQYRKFLPNENRSTHDAKALLAALEKN